MKRSWLHRLLNPEVIGAAVAGAALPYLVAYAVAIAPTRVPLWLVALSIGGVSSIAWLARSLIVRRRSAREEKERQEIERREYQTRLDRLERAVAEIGPRRRWLTRRRA